MASDNMTGVPPSLDRPLYYDMDGFRLSAAFNIDRYRAAIRYQPRDDDLFIATYPKCGTTWLQEICYLIFNHGEPPSSHLQRLVDTPFFEMLGPECVAKMRKPGAIKTHLPFNLVPWSPRAKYVYAIRNPKDCVVSFYHHTAITYPGYKFTDGTFEEFFELFMAGQTDFGCFFDHLESWAAQRDKSNILFVFFEDVKHNPTEELLRLASFLGAEYERELREGLMEKVLEKSSLKNMKKDFQKFALDPDNVQDVGIRQFALANRVSPEGMTEFKDHVRKGKVGGWRDHLTPEMSRRMDEKIRTRIEPKFPDIVAKWRDHGVMD